MATITLPALTTGATFSTNTFITVAWSPADSVIGSGSETEIAGVPGTILISPDQLLDLSTLGSAAGLINTATVNFSHAGTYSTVGPGALYTFNAFGESYSEADGAAWSSTSTYDATGFFAGTDIADLALFPWFAVFIGGGNIENGVTFGYTLSALTIDFDYTPSGGAVVTDVSPTHGDVAGNTVVTLTGTGFTGKTVASFGSTTTAFTPASDVSGTCVTPAHAFGQVTVTVS